MLSCGCIDAQTDLVLAQHTSQDSLTSCLRLLAQHAAKPDHLESLISTDDFRSVFASAYRLMHLVPDLSSECRRAATDLWRAAEKSASFNSIYQLVCKSLASDLRNHESGAACVKPNIPFWFLLMNFVVLPILS